MLSYLAFSLQLLNNILSLELQNLEYSFWKLIAVLPGTAASLYLYYAMTYLPTFFFPFKTDPSNSINLNHHSILREYLTSNSRFKIRSRETVKFHFSNSILRISTFFYAFSGLCKICRESLIS